MPLLTGQILIVDDDHLNRLVLQRHLTNHGYSAISAENGPTALALMRTTTVDLVLLDMVMPEMNGYAVLVAIKHDPTLRDVPVIMVSAADELTDIVACIEAGAEDYLPRQHDATLLKARINASLEKKHLRDQEIAYLRDVAIVAAAANAVETNTFDPTSLLLVAERDDALGHLARVFQQMAHEVGKREAHLKRQVDELQLRVDTTSQAQVVAEITGSAYFHELEEFAHDLRRRHTTTTPPPPPAPPTP